MKAAGLISGSCRSGILRGMYFVLASGPIFTNGTFFENNYGQKN
jgi:hypothetical protein